MEIPTVGHPTVPLITPPTTPVVSCIVLYLYMYKAGIEIPYSACRAFAQYTVANLVFSTIRPCTISKPEQSDCEIGEHGQQHL
jgi:hypothetical protein